jgi:hypothetical protein
LLAWLLPVLGLAGSAAVVAGIARRWAQPRRPDPPAPSATGGSARLEPSLERRLDEELARFDR